MAQVSSVFLDVGVLHAGSRGHCHSRCLYQSCTALRPPAVTLQVSRQTLQQTVFHERVSRLRARAYHHHCRHAQVSCCSASASLSKVRGSLHPSASEAYILQSPACILSFILTALARGEWSEAWAYEDGAKSPMQDRDLQPPGDISAPTPATGSTAPELEAGKAEPIDSVSEVQSSSKPKKRKSKKPNDD